MKKKKMKRLLKDAEENIVRLSNDWAEEAIRADDLEEELCAARNRIADLEEKLDGIETGETVPSTVFAQVLHQRDQYQRELSSTRHQLFAGRSVNQLGHEALEFALSRGLAGNAYDLSNLRHVMKVMIRRYDAYEQEKERANYWKAKCAEMAEENRELALTITILRGRVLYISDLLDNDPMEDDGR